MATSRIDELRMVDPVLTTVAQGYSNSAFIAEYLFPTVTVQKLKGKIPVFGRDAFIVRDTARAMRALSNRIPPADLELVSFETTERDLEAAVDYLEEEESPDFFRYEQRIARQLMDILLLGKEKEAADLAQDPANYDSGLKTVVEQATAWDDYTNDTDPIEVIREGLYAVRARIAHYPNIIIIGDSAFKSVINHPKLLERVKYSGVSKVNKAVLTELTGIQQIIIGTAVHSADGETFSDVWTDNVILAYVDPRDRQSRSEYNPSYGYTFQREGMPEIDTYQENGGKIKVVRATDNYTIKITASDAAFLISNTNHEQS